MTHTASPAPSLPRVDQRFTFHGLSDDALDGREITIVSLSVTGKVMFRIGFMGQVSRALHDASLTDVLTMIARGVWRPVEE